VYFAGKMVGVNGNAFVADRLGSLRSSAGQAVSFYPYGEDKGTPAANDQVKFATYTRDSVDLFDYADQRYYYSGWGRFLSPDPYKANNKGPGDPSDPQSWNRYIYTRGDPANRADPTGTNDCPDQSCGLDPGDDGPDWCDPSDASLASCSGYDQGDGAGRPIYIRLDNYQIYELGTLFNDGIINGWQLTPTGYDFTLTATDAGLIVPICVAQPELCLVLGAGTMIYVAYNYLPGFISAVQNTLEKSESWPACSPPVGSIGYRLDRVPPSRPKRGIPGDHVALYKMNQNPLNGRCFWQYLGSTPPPPPPGAVPMGPSGGGTNQ
jgi:RHS repeat-associated protein